MKVIWKEKQDAEKHINVTETSFDNIFLNKIEKMEKSSLSYF